MLAARTVPPIHLESSGSDLINHFKLDAEYFSDHILHTEYVSDPARGLRKVKVEKRWYRQGNIGHGGFGAVWLEVRREGESIKAQRAVKEINKGRMKAVKIDYRTELLALAKLSKYKEAFVEFFGWFDNNDTVFLTMEYLPFGDLAKYITPEITEWDAQQVTTQLLDGLCIMHQNGFTHRDLKPQNIFVISRFPSWWVKIGDFGITKRVLNEFTALRTETGTLHYQAPEIRGLVSGSEDTSEYTSVVDLWSLGCVVYQLICQKVPFQNSNALLLYVKGKAALPTTELASRSISQQGIGLIGDLLMPDSGKRVTAEVALRSPWLETTPESSISTPLGQYVPLELAASSNQQELVYLAPQREEDEARQKLEDETRQRLEDEARHREEDEARQKLEDETRQREEDEARQKLEDEARQKEEDEARQRLVDEARQRQEVDARKIRYEETHRQQKIVSQLLAKIKTNSNPAMNWTPLHVATEKGFELLLRALLTDVTLDINARAGTNGQTPLYQAAMKGYKTVAALLLDAGADQEIRMIADGYTALMIAAQKGYLEIVEVLLKKADVKAKSKAGWTALHLAAQNGHEAVVRSLLTKKPDIHARAGSNGQTPLYQAALSGRSVVVELLLNAGADRETKMISDGYTALMVAAERGHLNAVEVLLGNMADARAIYTAGWTALHLAAQNGHEAVVRSLLTKYPDIRARASTDGKMPLYQAAMKGYEGVVALLLKAGADQEAKMISDGYTALIIAAERGYLDVVEVLLANKANVRATSAAGWTALHVAAQNGHEAVVRSLLIKKPDIHARAGSNRQTPLYQAAMEGHEGVVALLLDYGADPNLGSKKLWNRTSPKEIADQNGHKGVVELLSKRQG